MPWIWNPLCGNIWVDAPGGINPVRRGGKAWGGCAGRKKMRCDEPVVKDERDTAQGRVIEVDIKGDLGEKTVDVETKPVVPQKIPSGPGDVCRSNLKEKFDQVAPGIFKFKHSNAAPASGQNGRLSLNNPASALPGDLGKYRMVGTAGDGTPVFTFT
ncbi:calponin homology domain-containing protein [Desulfotruncus alcoholivorax]|uniref:hypothetical protein n=1 Tax=Desulfotruncus alcoholivorax TaxID=265477 RepID=UPI00040CE918|nr:hypothetical protein [Desulfotruncus alcoholivorax]